MIVDFSNVYCKSKLLRKCIRPIIYSLSMFTGMIHILMFISHFLDPLFYVCTSPLSLHTLNGAIPISLYTTIPQSNQPIQRYTNFTLFRIPYSHTSPFCICVLNYAFVFHWWKSHLHIYLKDYAYARSACCLTNCSTWAPLRIPTNWSTTWPLWKAATVGKAAI